MKMGFDKYDKNIIKNFYNKKYYDDDFRRFPKSDKMMIASLLKKIELDGKSKVLDLCCGTGIYSKYFDDLNMEVFGLDISRVGISRSKKNTPKGEFLVGDAMNLPFKEESFDLIFCSGPSFFNTYDLNKLKKIIGNFFNLIKKDGFFVFIKTTTLSGEKSKNKSRINHTDKKMKAFFEKIEGTEILGAYNLYPQTFSVLGTNAFSNLISSICTLNTKISKIIVLLRNVFNMAKLIVFGIDGGNWELINPWIDNGLLPNIKKLRDGGCYSDHSSCLPPVTYPNWKCYSTGKNPGKLGVYRFDRIDCREKKLQLFNSKSFKSREIWDYMNANGIKTGIINMPTTYPPKKVDGFMVSGGPDATETRYRSEISGYTYPDNFEKYLKEKFNYRLHPYPYLSSKNDGEEEINSILELIDMRYALALDQVDKVDFLQVTCFYINAMQHFFWNGEPVKRAWMKIDKNIGKLIGKAEHIVMMSDHGCAKIEKVFYINRWLEKEGYLYLKNTIDDVFYNLGFSKENLLKLSKKLHLTKILNKVTPEFLLKLFPREEGVKGERKLDKVKWKNTVAVGSNQGPVYLNLDK